MCDVQLFAAPTTLYNSIAANKALSSNGRCDSPSLVDCLPGGAGVVHHFGNALPAAPPAVHAVKQYEICRHTGLKV